MCRWASGTMPGMDTLVDPSVDLVEWYYEQGFSDGLPVVPPTPEKIVAMLGRSAASRTWSSAGSRRAGAT